MSSGQDSGAGGRDFRDIPGAQDWCQAARKVRCRHLASILVPDPVVPEEGGQR